MERKRLIQYLPPVLQEVYEFRKLTAAEQPEFDRLYRSLESLMDNQFFDTLDEIGAARHEQILGITPKGTLEERRFKIKSRYNEQLPFTLRMLERQLTALVWADGYTLSVFYDTFRLAVRVDLVAKSCFESVREMLERVVPVNMVIDLQLMTNAAGILYAAGVIQTAKIMTLRQV